MITTYTNSDALWPGTGSSPSANELKSAKYSLIAQQAERGTVNLEVVGSTPT